VAAKWVSVADGEAVDTLANERRSPIAFAEAELIPETRSEAVVDAEADAKLCSDL
jgi:hypothetical protein